MPLGTPVYIEAPAVAPARGGLYAVADVRDGDVHIGASGFQYLSENCGVASAIDDPTCVTAEDRVEKTFGETSLVESTAPFAVYKGVECLDLQDDDSQWARRGLELTEHIAVEQQVMTDLLFGADDLTPVPGTPISVRDGIALLEGAGGYTYGGRLVFHMDRSATTIGFSEHVLEHDSDFTIFTQQGSLVANGAGYEFNVGPDGVPAGDGEAWIYVTGAVTVIRGPIIVNRVIPGVDASGAHTNLQMALAERMIAVSAECIKYAVLVEMVV